MSKTVNDIASDLSSKAASHAALAATYMQRFEELKEIAVTTPTQRAVAVLEETAKHFVDLASQEMVHAMSDAQQAMHLAICWSVAVVDDNPLAEITSLRRFDQTRIDFIEKYIMQWRATQKMSREQIEPVRSRFYAEGFKR